MPAATRYWSDNPTDGKDRELRQTADAERNARAAWRQTAHDYYMGNHPRPLKVRPGQPDLNVILNLVAQHVDHTVSFAVPEFPKMELDLDEQTDLETQIEQFWRAQGGAVWLGSLMRAGVLEGHCFVKLFPVTAFPYLRVIPLAPANVTVYWRDDDIDSVLWYEVRYTANGVDYREDIIAPETTDDNPSDWLIREYEKKAGDKWQLTLQANWGLEFPPVLDWQHLPKPHHRYGEHELHAVELNDAVNRAASNVQSILRVHASPRVVGFGFRAQGLQETGVDAMWTVDDKDARVEIIEMQSDLASSMAFINLLTNSYFQQARVTILPDGPDAYKGVTNLGIKAAFMSQLAKTETLHRQYARPLAKITQAFLSLMRVTVEEPRVVWDSNLPQSESEEAQTVAQKLNMGVLSKQGAAAELGINWQLESDRMLDEALVSDQMLAGFEIGVSG